MIVPAAGSRTPSGAQRNRFEDRPSEHPVAQNG